MKVFLEVTEWSVPTPNHIYILDDSKTKMFAYIKEGTKKIVKFKSPIDFSSRGRKFQELKHLKIPFKTEQPEGRTWTIAGSKGNSYTVSENGGKLKCSCSGFTFRGKCKHIDSVKV